MQLQPQPSQATLPSTLPIAPIDPQPIVQSDSPTAIILAIAILISIVMGSITGLVRVILIGMLQQSRSSR